MKRSYFTFGLLLFLLSILCVSCSSEKEMLNHEFIIIELKEYYDGKGAIIPDTIGQYEFSGGLNFKKTITPTPEQIRKAEKILSDDLFNYRMHKLRSTGNNFQNDSMHNEILVGFLNNRVEEEKKVIRQYYRQYCACMDENDEIIIQITLFNYSTIQTRHRFDGWRYKIIPVSTDDFFYANTRNYFVNITKGMISR